MVTTTTATTAVTGELSGKCVKNLHYLCEWSLGLAVALFVQSDMYACSSGWEWATRTTWQDTQSQVGQTPNLNGRDRESLFVLPPSARLGSMQFNICWMRYPGWWLRWEGEVVSIWVTTDRCTHFVVLLTEWLCVYEFFVDILR